MSSKNQPKRKQRKNLPQQSNTSTTVAESAPRRSARRATSAWKDRAAKAISSASGKANKKKNVAKKVAEIDSSDNELQSEEVSQQEVEEVKRYGPPPKK